MAGAGLRPGLGSFLKHKGTSHECVTCILTLWENPVSGLLIKHKERKQNPRIPTKAVCPGTGPALTLCGLGHMQNTDYMLTFSKDIKQ